MSNQIEIPGLDHSFVNGEWVPTEAWWRRQQRLTKPSTEKPLEAAIAIPDDKTHTQEPIHLPESKKQATEPESDGAIAIPNELTRHVCHARGCDRAVSPAMLMCRKHWAAVPKNLKNQVYKHYRLGQELDKVVTRDYLAAAKEAIDFVAAVTQRKEQLEIISNQTPLTPDGVRWWQEKDTYYLSLMGKMARSPNLTAKAKRCETSRLMALREKCAVMLGQIN